MTTPDAKRKGLALVAEIDEAELALRLAEIGIGLRRPSDSEKTAAELLRQLEAGWPAEGGPFPFGTMARRAIEYFRECINKGQTPA